jgi:hypothetical protein
VAGDCTLKKVKITRMNVLGKKDMSEHIFIFMFAVLR